MIQYNHIVTLWWLNMNEKSFCKRCNVEHPDINGLLDNEIVRGSYPVNYRGLTFEIWIIENPNSHFWGWCVATGETYAIINKILYELGYYIPQFSEAYCMPSYIYREEKLKTKDLALEYAKKTLIEIGDFIRDSLLQQEETKVGQLREILSEVKEG